MRKVKIDFCVSQMDGASGITSIVEKPTIDYLVSMCFYIFEPRVIGYIPKGKYLEFPDLIQMLLVAGEKVAGYSFDGYWQDLIWAARMIMSRLQWILRICAANFYPSSKCLIRFVPDQESI